MTFINDLFEYTFLARALFTASVVGLVCGVIGSFIILRGLSLMGDAISHAVLPGIALAFIELDAGLKKGDEVVVDVRGREVPCRLAVPPLIEIRTR